MSSSRLERVRQLHEEVEKNERLAVSDFKVRPLKGPEMLMQDHRVFEMIKQVQQTQQTLLEIYEDRDGTLKQDIESMGGSTDEATVMSRFYERLSGINEYYKRFPNEMYDPAKDKSMEADRTRIGEEGGGRFLDLHNIYNIYTNLPQYQKKVKPYVMYISSFQQDLSRIVPHEKDRQFYAYVKAMHDYLSSFIQRTQPLTNITNALEQYNGEFEQVWHDGRRMPGWANYSPPAMYCVACAKQMTNENVYKSHLTSKKHLTAVEGKEREMFEKDLALLEFRILKYCEILADTIEDTHQNIELKQSRTLEEILADIEAQEMQAVEPEPESSDEEGEQKDEVYNPKNVPLDFDGKPIPYWLYKLHGLNFEYKCEICGGESYRGRKIFEKHFNEWRHAQGLRALGIPVTRHFKDITSIDEAVKLWNKIKDDMKKQLFDPDLGEEYEDAEGNVYNRKTYLDLKRQNLV